MNEAGNTFYVTGGTLRPNAPSYVERQADKDLFEGLLKGEFCYILTSRQMGKSSLMVRTAQKLRDQGVNVIVLDLTAVGQNLTAEQWYDGLLLRVGRQLRVEDEIEDFWMGHMRLGPCQRFFATFAELLLPRLNSQAKARGARETASPLLVIFVDELDVVRSLPFSTDEFFAAIRECYTRRSVEPEMSCLTFCLLGVATPSDLIRDTRITPFNIGRRIELGDFTASVVTPLARGLERPACTEAMAKAMLDRILYWTAGHPYLTQRLCRAAVESEWEDGPPAHGSNQTSVRANSAKRLLPCERIDSLCEDLFFSNRARERDDNLIFVRERLLRSEVDIVRLLELYLKVRRGKCVGDDETNRLVSVLLLSGIVKVEQGELRKRNRIYYRVFDPQWVRLNMPGAEVERQRKAFRRGVIRTTAVASVIVTVLAVAMVVAVKSAAQARRASAEAHFAQAQATQVSGLSGQRFKTLRAIQEAARDYGNHDALRDLAAAALSLVDLETNRTWQGAPPGTATVGLSPDFQFYARGESSGHISVHSVTNDQEIASLAGADLIPELILFSRDNRYLAVQSRSDSRHELMVWDWAKHKAVLTLAEEISSTAALDFSSDSRKLAVGFRSGRLRVYSLEKGELLSDWALELATKQPRRPNCIRFHPSANLLAESCDSSFLVQLWNWETREKLGAVYHRDRVLSLDWHPRGDMLATGCKNGGIYLWGMPPGQGEPMMLQGHVGEVFRLAFNHAGDLLASHSSDKTVRLWVPQTGRGVTHSLESGQIKTLLFSLDDQQLGLLQNDSALQTLQTWRVSAAPECRCLPGSGAARELARLDFRFDGLFLSAAVDDGILLWNLARLNRPEVLLKMTTYAAGFDPITGDLMASGSYGFRRWTFSPVEGRSAQLRLTLTGTNSIPENSRAFAVSRDGSTLVVVHRTSIYLLKSAGAEEPFELPVGAFYDAIELSSDGKLMAAHTVLNNEVHLWNLATRARVAGMNILKAGRSFCFSPDGNWFVIGSDNECAFWRVDKWERSKQCIPLRHARQQACPMAFSGDGHVFALATSPATIELFQMPEAKPFLKFESPDRKPFLQLALSAHADKLAAAGRDQSVIVWDLTRISKQLASYGVNSTLPDFSTQMPATETLELELPTPESN